MGHIAILYLHEDQIPSSIASDNGNNDELFTCLSGYQVICYDQYQDETKISSNHIPRCIMIGIPIEMSQDVCLISSFDTFY